MLLSILVPVYNVESCLVRCINSLLMQTYKELEIILIDDGSTDNSGDICDQYAMLDGRIRVIHKKNEGPSSARFAGLLASRGEYVAFVDSDDYLDYDMFAQLMEPLLEDSCIDISIGGHVINRIDGSIVNSFADRSRQLYQDSVEALADMFEGKRFVWSLCGKIYRKELFIKGDVMRTCPAFHGDDAYANSQIFPMAKKMIFIPVYGYHYCMRSDSMMHKAFDSSRLVTVNVLCQLMEKYYNISDRLFKAIGKVFIGLAMQYLKDILDKFTKYQDDIMCLQENVAAWRYKLVLDVQEGYVVEHLLMEPCVYVRWREKKLKKFYDFCSADTINGGVYIYGTGVYGKKTLELLISNGINIAGFMESAPKKPMFKNYTIYRASDIAKGTRVIVAMSYKNSMFVQELVQEKSFDVLYIWEYFWLF